MVIKIILKNNLINFRNTRRHLKLRQVQETEQEEGAERAQKVQEQSQERAKETEAARQEKIQ